MEHENRQKHCPKCGKENPDDTQYCKVCGSAFLDMKIDIKINKDAIASFVCALIAFGCFVPGLVAILDPRSFNSQSEILQNIACVSIVTGGIAMLLGILALSRIGLSGGRQTGYGFAVIGTAIPPILIFILAWFNIGRWRATIPLHRVCGTNLSGIGKAMLIYSNDYDDELPVAGDSNSVWVARISDWKAANRSKAYKINPDGTSGRASISSSLYLLIKYYDVAPKLFVCRGDYGTNEFRPAEYGVDNRRLSDLWDFGPNPPRHCSYSYHIPYGLYRLTTALEPGLAIAADRNPWIDSPFEKAGDFRAFDPNGGPKAVRAGNTFAHYRDGQNVLFLDNHVGFEDRSFCGFNDDNIYTYWDGTDIRRGAPPTLGNHPADGMDSLLVNDPATPK